jgi:hypothetical protein
MLSWLVPKSATAMSGRPSPLKSPTATASGCVAVDTDRLVATWKVVSPTPIRTDTSLPPLLADTMSLMPSPFVSPTARPSGLASTPVGITVQLPPLV